MRHIARIFNNFSTFAQASVESLAFPFNRSNAGLLPNMPVGPFNRLNETSHGPDLPFNRLNASLRQSDLATDPGSFNRLNAGLCQAHRSPEAKPFNRLNEASREPTRPPRKRFNRLNTRSLITQKKTPRLPGAFSFGLFDSIGDRP